MKKFYSYGMVVVCTCLSLLANAQTRYWVGPAGGNWNSTSNWSTASGGGSGASVPNGSGFDVIFDQAASVNIDLGSISLGTLTVTGNSTVKLYTSIATNITLNAASNALAINTGSRLEDSCVTNVAFDVTFAAGAQGVVDGTWYFSGAGGVIPPQGATFALPAAGGQGNRLDVNGTIIFKNNTRTPSPGATAGGEYLFFNNGSVYQLDRNGGAVPHANWDANATISITGVVDAAPTINLLGTPAIGNLVFNCPNLSPVTAVFDLALSANMIIKGNLQILNTNNNNVALLTSLGVAGSAVPITVQGDFDISGTSIVYIANDDTKSFSVEVDGDFNLSGGSFLMQRSNSVTTTTTTLSLGGDLNYTGGTFGCSSTASSTSVELFVVELSGTANQNISSYTGTIDNAGNMVTLRMNNTAGATLLTPLSVGKISWNSVNQGNLTTTATNFLAINNPSATDPLVVNGPSDAGYVNGPVRRATNSAGTYLFPTGKGGSLRYAEVIPNSTTASVFTAEYFNSSFGDLTFLGPLTGVSNAEYWTIARNSGSDAAVQLNLDGAVPGATSGDGIVVARYNGADWVTVKGASGNVLPGASTSGNVVSDAGLVSFGSFTFGIGPAGALPIDLLSFNVRKLSGDAAQVTWTISASSTPDKFEILRSADGTHFSSLGIVAAGTNRTDYSFSDNNLPKGVSWYRLRMTDIDGSVKLSKIVAVTNGVKGVLITAMMPTLVTDRARLNISSSEKTSLQLVVTDIQGRIVKQQIVGIETGNQEIWMNLAALASGTYQVTGYVEGERSSTIRFIKQ